MRLAQLLALLPAATVAKDNGLARTPPMGWSSWNAYGGHQSEQMMRDAGDQLVAKGLAKLGYTSVDMDGGWMNFNKHGIKKGDKGPWDMRAVADYLHSKNLTMGMCKSPTLCLASRRLELTHLCWLRGRRDGWHGRRVQA